MSLDFKKILPPDVYAKYEQQRTEYERDVAEARAMDDEMLADRCEYFLTQCELSSRWAPGTPVYDSAVHHVMVPEMIRRLRERAKKS